MTDKKVGNELDSEAYIDVNDPSVPRSAFDYRQTTFVTYMATLHFFLHITYKYLFT